MATRQLCITPCVPNLDLVPSLRIPLAGPISAGGDLSLKASCTGCELVANLMLQISPFIMSLGLPLCLLKCAMGLINPILDMKDIVTSLPVPPVEAITKFVDDVTKLPGEDACGCVIALLLPTGFCVYVVFIYDFLGMIVGILTCLKSLMEHLLKLNLQASAMGADVDIETQKVAACLLSYNGAQQSKLIVKFDAVRQIFKLLQALFVLVESIIPGYPTEAKFSTILAMFDGFKATVETPDIGLGDVITAIEDLISVLGPLDNPEAPSVRGLLKPIVNLCGV